MSTITRKPRFGLQGIVNVSLFFYPVVAHIGVLIDQLVWPVCYLAIAIYLSSIKFLFRHKILGVFITLIMCVLIYAVITLDSFPLAIFIPPILIPCWLAFVFFRSIATNNAVIATIARRIEGKELDAKHLLYTQRLTVLWGIIFLMMVGEGITLAIWAPFEVWSWWVHVGNYFVILVLFVIEIMFRHRFIDQQPKVFQLLKVLSQGNWRKQ